MKPVWVIRWTGMKIEDCWVFEEEPSYRQIATLIKQKHGRLAHSRDVRIEQRLIIRSINEVIEATSEGTSS